MKNVAQLCQSTLNHIFQRLGTLKRLQIEVQGYLPQEIRAYCRVANFENGVLKLAVSSSVWASKLRYLIPELLSTLRKEANLPQLASITFYVEPAFERLFGEHTKKEL